MLQKPKNWLTEALWKPKKVHSLEQLRYLHYILQRNSTVTEGNKALLVETLRSIAEILIWGDQNDSTVFDFFLEKNMLLFFLKIMTQNCGSYITVQLLQTLNILFENIKNETSLYFLLSNNHVNSIIVHKFDFSNEEVLAYYISFLKTLSLKLNSQTINFFFNERKSDFPLYTEGIKFFHHPESMVRIAVRTLTLNVCKVGHEKMLEFICDKTATPYFSNLVWFIGKDAIELDDCVLQETDHFKFDKLKASLADHLDHLHYLNDILQLRIDLLNIILTDHMINRLLIPLYIYSLPTKEDFGKKDLERVRISKLVALFLLAQHLMIMTHQPLVNAIVDVIFNEDDIRTTAYMAAHPLNDDQKSLLSNTSSSSRAFIPPPAPLESQLEAYGVTKDSYNLSMKLKMLTTDKTKNRNSTFYIAADGTLTLLEDSATSGSDREDATSEHESSGFHTGDEQGVELSEFDSKKTKESVALLKDEGKENITKQDKRKSSIVINHPLIETQENSNHDSNNDIYLDSNEDMPDGQRRIFVQNILKSLDCSGEDGEGFFALCLFYAILTNKGVDEELLKDIGLASPKITDEYNEDIMEKLLIFLEQGVRDGSKMRLVTFEMCIKVVRLIIIDGDNRRPIKDRHYAMIQNILEASTLQLRNFYKGDDLFVHTFEGQYHHMKAKPLNVEYVAMDASLLLPATVTPLTGIDFMKRLPCGDDERTQRASHIFILMRELSLDFHREAESYLPLSKVANTVRETEVLDLNNSDLIACTIVQQNKQSVRRFLVIDTSQFILVEPDTSKLGWGLVKFVSHLQDVEATPDKDDSRSLHIVIQQPFSRRSKSGFNPLPLLTAKFIFDDYIRCMSARQRLQKRRDTLRHRKMTTIATLLELPALAAPPSQFYSLTNYDGSPNTVWSPSSRSYSSSKLSSKQSSPNASSSNLNLTPIPLNNQKSKILSPKHEEILQRQFSKQEIATSKSHAKNFNKSNSIDSNEFGTHNVGSSVPTTPRKSEADSLACLLQASPPPPPPSVFETHGREAYRGRTDTTEIGEEICEEGISLSESSSSFVMLNSSVSVERCNTSKDVSVERCNSSNKVAIVSVEKQLSHETRKLSSSKSVENFTVSETPTSKLNPSKSLEKLMANETDNKKMKPVINKISEEKHRSNSTSDCPTTQKDSKSESKKSGSAPSSPSGRRKERFVVSNDDTERLSKSLPSMAFTSTSTQQQNDDRKQRAQRARAKAKNVKSRSRKTKR